LRELLGGRAIGVGGRRGVGPEKKEKGKGKKVKVGKPKTFSL
jgi:hypothetical protein